ncbi:hypothetical protein ACIQLJ_05240 [Microbacterium sp. NPDC091313]
MNTTLERARPFDRLAQPAHPAFDWNELDAISVRVSPLDRLSLRLGVWLLLRGARHVRPACTHASQACDVSVARELQARERRAVRSRALAPTI